jgi:hypothetical protein
MFFLDYVFKCSIHYHSMSDTELEKGAHPLI